MVCAVKEVKHIYHEIIETVIFFGHIINIFYSGLEGPPGQAGARGSDGMIGPVGPAVSRKLIIYVND